MRAQERSTPPAAQPADATAAGPGGTVTLTLNPALDMAFAIPRLVPAQKIRCGHPETHPGGGGVNVARVLNALGEPVTAILPVAGHTGAVLVDLLTAAGVRTSTVPSAGETRLSHQVTDLETGLEYRFVLPGPPLGAGVVDRCLEELRVRAREDELVVLSGSLPPGVDPDVVSRVADAVAESGARLVVDTSGAALAAVRRAYLLKPSVRELEALAGRPLPRYDEQVRYARELLDWAGTEVVVLSSGGDGITVITKSSTDRVPAVAGPVVSTVGAGDALVAGLVVGLRHGWPLARAGRFAVACAAAMVACAGTSVFARDDLARFTDEQLPPPVTASDGQSRTAYHR